MPLQISGLEDLLTTGAGVEIPSLDLSGAAAAGANTLAIPHATEAYARILERARAEAGPGNVARAEAAVFALMYGPSLAPPASPFTQQDPKVPAVGVPAFGHGPGRSHSGHHGGGRHAGRPEEAGGAGAITQLGRRSLSLRVSSSQVGLLGQCRMCWASATPRPRPIGRALAPSRDEGFLMQEQGCRWEHADDVFLRTQASSFEV